MDVLLAFGHRVSIHMQNGDMQEKAMVGCALADTFCAHQLALSVAVGLNHSTQGNSMRVK